MAATKLIDTKSILAKLMASENIVVLHENIPTAAFDMKNRVLHCPVWKDMSSDLYDLVMGHEIGHALNTPEEGWHNAVLTCKQDHDHDQICYDSNFKFFLNVCEDARIEKKIKRKFPGLKKSFSEAYKKLHDRDFFGIKKLKDINDLNFIDRVNVFFKLGSFIPVQFSHEESDIVRKLENAETFEDVVSIAREIYAVSQNEKNKINSLDDLKENIQNGGNKKQEAPGNSQNNQAKQNSSKQQESKKSKSSTDKKEKSSKNEKSKEKSSSEKGEDKQSSDKKEDGESQDESSNQDSENSSDNEQKSKKDRSGSDGYDESDSEKGDSESDSDSDGNCENDEPSDEDGEEDDSKPKTFDGDIGGVGRGSNKPVSVTDKVFRDHERELIDTNARNFVNATLPTPSLDKLVKKVEEILKMFEFNAERQFSIANKDYRTTTDELIKYFTHKNKNFINMLLKEFEMRKNAIQYNRAKIHRSGELDTRRLSQYAFTNDIFRKITQVPKGKSHGMVLFLDMSSSMSGPYMHGAIEQIIILTTFCNKAKIPYDVYGFADQGCWGYQGFSRNPLDLSIGQRLSLRHMLSSRSTSAIQKRSMRMLALYAAMMASRRVYAYGNPQYSNNKIGEIMGNIQFTNDCGLDLGGTPLEETIIASRKIIDEFKNTTQVDIVNVIHLTDGAGSCTVTLPQGGRNSRVMLTDPITKKFVVIEDFGNAQAELTSFIRQLTNCRHIGFYICSLSEVKSNAQRNRTYRKAESNSTKIKNRTDEVEKYGFYNAKTLGYDNYYFISSEFMGLESQQVKGSDALGTFMKTQESKKAARIILSQFAQEIATIDSNEKFVEGK